MRERSINAESLMSRFGDDGSRTFSTAEIKAIIDTELTAEPDTMTIRINTHGGPLPEKHGEWVDLYSAEDVWLIPGQYKLISLGVSMELPEGYYAEVAPRSSTCGRYGIVMANSIGIIENDYNGDEDVWHFPAYAIRDTHVPKGVRIAQFRLVRQDVQISFEQVDALGNANRGGFGSTGV